MILTISDTEAIMKAYLRFRMPYELARTFSDNVRDTFHGQIDLYETKKPSTFHVTLAYFSDITPENIPRMNDSIFAACVKYADQRPFIKLCGYDIFEENSKTKFVALAEVHPFKHWEACRAELLAKSNEFAPKAFRETWNPHVTLGVTSQKKLKGVDRDVPPFFSWTPDRIELVLKLYPDDPKQARTDIILPAWQLIKAA